MQWGVCNPKFKEPQVLFEELEGIKQKVWNMRAEGWVVCQMDEAVFSPKAYNDRVWAPKGNPITTSLRLQYKRYVSVMAVICVEQGGVDYMTKTGEAMKTEDVVELMKRVRIQAGRSPKIAIFVDGASIHKAAAQRCREDPNINIEFIFNQSYRPDLMGVEVYWNRIKHFYKKFCLAYKPLHEDWDNEPVVKECLNKLSPKQVSDCAQIGFNNLWKAKIKERKQPVYARPSLITSIGQ